MFNIISFEVIVFIECVNITQLYPLLTDPLIEKSLYMYILEIFHNMKKNFFNHQPIL